MISITWSRITDIEEILSIISNSQKKALKELERFNHELAEETSLDVGEEKEINQSNVHDDSNRYLAEKGVGMNNLKGVANKSVREKLIKLLIEKSNLSLKGIAATLDLNREILKIDNILTLYQ